MFGPPRLGRLAQQSASLFRTDVPPARGPQTNRRSLDRLWGEPAARNVQQLKGEIEEDFWRKARLAHHAPESGRSSRTEKA